MILKIGHRGCAYGPENTLLAFKKAISLGVDMIECDARLTKDKQVVIIHDTTVNRTTDETGRVSDLNLKEIKKLDAGKGEQIPTLEEVINIAKNNVKLNIEVKEMKAARKVAEVLARNKFVRDSLVSASDVELLKIIRKINPQINTALVYKSLKNKFSQFWFDPFSSFFSFFLKKTILKKIKRAQTKTVNLRKNLATKKMIDYLHQKGIKVNVWTV
ncbi:MAG: glycerophosphodiester phosphodiesterase family protein, partial [Candidatus Woesearchaeota archaeon]